MKEPGVLKYLSDADPEGCRLFWDDEDAYLAWVHANPDGFVANCDKAGVVRQYPMIHRTSHGAMWTPKRSNYTTEKYFKVCARHADDLSAWAHNRGLQLTRCKTGPCASIDASVYATASAPTLAPGEPDEVQRKRSTESMK